MKNQSDKSLNWNYKMNNTRLSCTIQSETDDNICKMLWEDTADNAIHEEYAQLICISPQMAQQLIIVRDELKTETEFNRLRGEGKDWSKRIEEIESILSKLNPNFKTSQK
jgi:hypothetical protein